MPAQRPRWARTVLIVVGSLLGWAAFMTILSWLAG
jgi:hypothetical protein